MENPQNNAFQPRRLQKHLVKILMNWYDNADCKDMDTDMFFPLRAGSYVDAYKICNGVVRGKSACPVRADCLFFALSFPAELDKDGMFGGMTPPERARIRKGKQVETPAPYRRRKQ